MGIGSVAFLGFLVCRGCVAGEDLTYRREEGEIRTYLRTMLAEGKLASGADGSFRFEATTKEKTVESIPGLRVVSDVLLERIRVQVSTGLPGDPQAFDTDEPIPPGEAAGKAIARRSIPFRRMAGSTITIHQQPSGVIEKFEGLEALHARVMEGVAEDAPERHVYEGLTTPGWMQNLLAPDLRVPTTRVIVGESQAVLETRMLPENVGMPGILYYRGDYRLTSVKEGEARVDFSGEVSLDPFPGMPPWPAVFAAKRKLLRLDRGVFHAWARIGIGKGVLEEDEHVTELDLVFLGKDGKGETPLPTKVTRSTRLIR